MIKRPTKPIIKIKKRKNEWRLGVTIDRVKIKKDSGASKEKKERGVKYSQNL